MKISATKKYLIYPFILCFFLSSKVFAQDSVKHHWVVPASMVVQHAGSIGYFSVAAGYYLNRSHKTTLDIGYGYVPVKFGGDLNILAAKLIWRPFTIPLKEWGIIYPVNPGIFISYHAGGDYDSTWDDDQYPKGYYWWSTAIRPHIAFGHELKLNTQKIFPDFKARSLSVYAEFNTNELYMVSYIQNRHDLNLRKIFKLGLGARLEF